MEHAGIQQGSSSITVVALAPLPLFQVICGVREHYGWRVNWEQAPGYSRFDVVDDTGPKWRAAHPDAKGVTRPAGGRFTSTFPAPLISSEADVLAKLVQDYNATDNPGKYVLLSDRLKALTVVGNQVKDESGALQAVPPLLDTRLTIAKATRSVDETVRTTLATLSATTGSKVIIMSVPNNLFRNAEVTLGGNSVPARQLLQEALDSTLRPLQYDLGYDPDVPAFILNVSTAVKETDDGLGRKVLIPIDRAH